MIVCQSGKTVFTRLWDGHEIAAEVNHRLLYGIGYLEVAVVHIDPVQKSGEAHHHRESHSHDGLPVHSHQAVSSRMKTRLLPGDGFGVL